MQFFTELIQQSLDRSREASLSVLGISNPALREQLSEQLSDELGASGSFLAPPVFEHTFGWQEAPETLGELTPLLSPAMLLNLEKAHAYRFAPTSHPYTHQLQAWRTLLSEPPTSTVITSGTGSGKTECFMVPILEDLIREQAQLGTPLVGVRALFLYPLNALINSQQERLDAWTRTFGDKLRFCLYNGKTKEKEGQVRDWRRDNPEKFGKNQVLSREVLRRDPPPILLTNATMLEYMLVRQVDSPIVDISRAAQSLRWIVLDEAHTYVGSQAAELSLLLRRVVHAFGKQSEQIRFIATSATIADENARKRLQDYLAGLAGIRPERVVVIGGTRVVPELTRSAAPHWDGAEKVRSIEQEQPLSAARFQALADSAIATRLRQHIVSSSKPVDLNELVATVAEALPPGTLAAQQRHVLAWLDLMTGTTRAPAEPPFLRLRIHLFQRMLHGLWSCVDPRCDAKHERLAQWPFGNVYVSQKARCECGAPVYELAFCDDCKAPHLLAEDVDGKLVQHSVNAGDEFALNYEAGDEDRAASQDAANRRRAPKLVRTSAGECTEAYLDVPLDLDSATLGSLTSTRQLTVFLSDREDLCGCCSASPNEHRYMRKSYLGAPFYVANAVPTVLEFCPDPDPADLQGKSLDELPARGRRLITFTDSRQGTARMAVRMQQEAERSKLRGLVFEILRNEQAAQEAQPRDLPTVSYEELVTQAANLDRMGMEEMANKLRAKAEAMRNGDAMPAATGMPWQTLVDRLASQFDVRESILNYNRYANPALFTGGGGEKTMARLLLAREFARRPKNQNSSETLGLVKVSYLGLERVAPPPEWLDTRAVRVDGADSERLSERLSERDWSDFLKVALDFFVRENTYIQLDPTMQFWMGSRFNAKTLVPPTRDIAESSRVKRWPQWRGGQGGRLIKLLERATGFDAGADSLHRNKINLWLESAWKDLVHAQVLQENGGLYSLRLERLAFSLPSQAWVCPVTNRLLDTAFRGLTPYLPSRTVVGSFQCRKVDLPQLSTLKTDGSNTPKLSQIRALTATNTAIAGLRSENLWTDLSDRTVEGGFYYRTAEHSAQQSADKLQRYEDMFKAGQINVLNCSTTMEMGVDIGGISAVVMNNVPPHPANYLQRAGRAGRRNEPRAIAYTLCKGDPHNRRVFSQPKWPFVTAIPAPSVMLSSDRIVQRHVNSFFLAAFLRAHDSAAGGDRTKLHVKWFFDGGDAAPARQFAAWLGALPPQLGAGLQTIVRGTGLGGRSLDSIIAETLEALRQISDYWVSEAEKLRTRAASASDEPYKRALKFELERHEEAFLLHELAARAFLPGYGFPTNVVNLNTYNIAEFAEQRRRRETQDREDNIFTLKEQPTRSLDVAIREYAPGAQIVIDGRVHRSAGVALPWHADGGRREAQKFNKAWRCAECGCSGVVENAYVNSANLHCTNCNAPIGLAEQKLVLRPSGFVTDFYEPSTNDIDNQKFIRVGRPRVSLNGEVLALPDARCGFLRFGHDGTIFHHSSGEHERGYAICLSCGRAESMSADGKVPPALRADQSHRPVGGITGSKREHSCPGTGVQANVHLGFQTRTDVLELLLRSPANQNWLSDSAEHQVLARTMALAMRDTIASSLGIASSEIGYGIRLDKDLESKTGRSVIQLFDQVSGGAGFVLAALDDIVQFLKALEGKLNCPVSCDNVCPSCLASQDSRAESEDLNRPGARDWLRENAFLSHLVLPPVLAGIPGAHYCSYEPQRFIRQAINRGATAITVSLRGEPADWDLNYPELRNRVLTWSAVDKLEVSLAVSRPDSLPENVKQALATYSALGIRILELDESWGIAGLPMVAQIAGPEQIDSLFATDEASLTPGEYWLATDATTVWASTEKIGTRNLASIDTAEWKFVPSGATVVEVTSELNGGLASLSSRLRSLFASRVPALSSMIDNDRAISISYSDRYIKSPWSLMLLSEILSVFKNEDLRHVHIQALAPDPKRPSSELKHDWMTERMQADVIREWLSEELDVALAIDIRQKSHEVQHTRMITIGWKSGKQSRIMLDQGTGYWTPRALYRDELFFNFSDTTEMQLSVMRERQRSVLVSNSGTWPTYITVLGG